MAFVGAKSSSIFMPKTTLPNLLKENLFSSGRRESDKPISGGGAQINSIRSIEFSAKKISPETATTNISFVEDNNRTHQLSDNDSTLLHNLDSTHNYTGY